MQQIRPTIAEKTQMFADFLAEVSLRGKWREIWSWMPTGSPEPLPRDASEEHGFRGQMPETPTWVPMCLRKRHWKSTSEEDVPFVEGDNLKHVTRKRRGQWIFFGSKKRAFVCMQKHFSKWNL
jgi:hypothetical protein